MEDNKLIAEFMGMTSHEQDGGCMIQMTHQGNEVVLVSSLKYHTSWDWLMPVVSKIARNEEYFENVWSERLFDIVPFGRIEEVYEVVVEFIKEYNK